MEQIEFIQKGFAYLYEHSSSCCVFTLLLLLLLLLRVVKISADDVKGHLSVSTCPKKKKKKD